MDAPHASRENVSSARALSTSVQAHFWPPAGSDPPRHISYATRRQSLHHRPSEAMPAKSKDSRKKLRQKHSHFGNRSRFFHLEAKAKATETRQREFLCFSAL